MSANTKKARRENPLLNIGLNIALPAIVLMQLSREDRLGPVYGLLLALAFPVGYGLYDFAARRGFNFYSALGFVSVLLTGGIGLLKLPVEWLAIKEAAVPFIAGIAVLVSL
ncbi:MAG: MFS transporter, partial [Chloroflexota bacterium]|nr:MFS transporter [Chloroflexota bacterium]